MAEEYGPIFKLDIPGGIRLLISGPDLVNEVCDDTRFDKKVSGGLANLGTGRHRAVHRRDGRPASTAPTTSSWHRSASSRCATTCPRCSTSPTSSWTSGRVNPGEQVDVPADMTRPARHDRACGFGYRFNSFYRETRTRSSTR